jgi:hypothetical protein
MHFALTLWTAHLGYSYFRDEFYFLACGRHLAWGYVDQGPIVAVMARLGTLLFGDSVFSIRILPALAGALLIGVSGLLTWALGGGRSAQALAMLGLLLVPVYIGCQGFLSIVCMEPLFWTACVLCLVLLQQGGPPRELWLTLGLLCGVGLLNKPSMLFFLVALFAGLLLTPERRLLRSPWLLAAAALALLLVSPFLLWEAHNHWATWEFLRNGQLEGKNARLAPPAFLLQQISQLNPVTSLLWVTGVIATLRARTLAGYRWIGLSFLLFLGLMMAMHAKDYYVAPVYPMLFAAGGVAWEARLRHRQSGSNRLFAFPVYESVLILTGLILLPMSSPVLRPAPWAQYTQALHLRTRETETLKTSILPQFFADRFGWDEMTSIVVAGYRALPSEDRAHVCIFANNYGEAASLEFLGRRAEPALPPVISPHNNYWLWGMRGCDAHTLIAVVPDKPEKLSKRWGSVTLLGQTSNPLAMPYEHKNIYLLREPKGDHPVNWQHEKDYI